MEDIIRLFRKSLLDAFGDWLEKNEEAIGKWYDSLQKQPWRDCATPIEIVSMALWMFSMIANLGVLAGVGPNNLNIVEIRKGLDEKSSKRLLLMIQNCLNLQYLPKDIATKPIPIISRKRFSLEEYIRLSS